MSRLNDSEARQIGSNPDGSNDDEIRQLLDFLGTNIKPVRPSHILWGHHMKDTCKAVILLREYCHNLLLARATRLKGKIRRAKSYETLCENIYNNMPEWSRW